MPRPDEGLIHAWLDGELNAAEAARVEKLVAEDAEWSAAAAEARGLIAASTRILGALDVVAGDVIPQGGSAAPALDAARVPRVAPSIAPKVASRRVVPTWMRVAAGLVLVAGIGYVGRDGMGFSARDDASNAATGVSAVPAVPATEMAAELRATDSATRETAVSAAAQAANAAPNAAEVAAPRVEASPPARVAAASPAPRRDAMAAAPPPAALDAVVGAAGAAASDSRSRAEIAAVVADSTGALQRARRAELERRFSSESRLEQVVVTGAVQKAAADQPPTRQPMQAVTPPASAPSASLAAPPAAQKVAAVQDAAASGAGARSLRVSAQSDPAYIGVISGCWRTTTTGVSDSLLTSVPILRQLGDTLVVRVNAGGAEAKVIRGRTTALGVSSLVGRAKTGEGETVLFVAELVACRR